MCFGHKYPQTLIPNCHRHPTTCSPPSFVLCFLGLTESNQCCLYVHVCRIIYWNMHNIPRTHPWRKLFLPKQGLCGQPQMLRFHEYNNLGMSCPEGAVCSYPHPCQPLVLIIFLPPSALWIGVVIHMFWLEMGTPLSLVPCVLTTLESLY